MISSKKRKMEERREYQRFRTEDGTFAVFGPHSSKIGQIIDISMGGLAFHYMPGEEPNGSKELNIFLAESSFYLKKIPFETVWDQEARQVPFSTINVRRCGVEFGALSEAQSSELELFIENHTIDRA